MYVRSLLACSLALVGLVACGVIAPAGCGEVGGASGVTITLPKQLYREGREAVVELCQGEICESTSSTLYDDGQTKVSADFPRFASTFAAGRAQVQVIVRNGAQVVRVMTGGVDLARNYPNGRDCDGDSWLSGESRVR